MILFLLFLFTIFVYFILNPIHKKENWGTSPGTLIQLEAKGPQDIYLTGLPNYYYHHPYSFYYPNFYLGGYNYYRPYYY